MVARIADFRLRLIMETEVSISRVLAAKIGVEPALIRGCEEEGLIYFTWSVPGPVPVLQKSSFSIGRGVVVKRNLGDCT